MSSVRSTEVNLQTASPFSVIIESIILMLSNSHSSGPLLVSGSLVPADVGNDGDDRRREVRSASTSTLSNQFLFSSLSQTYYLNNERRDLITVRNLENF